MTDSEPADSNSPTSPVTPRVKLAAHSDDTSRSSVKWVMSLLVAWGIVIALGVARYDYQHDQLNLVKPLVVILCTLAAVGGWQLALRRRHARR